MRKRHWNLTCVVSTRLFLLTVFLSTAVPAAQATTVSIAAAKLFEDSFITYDSNGDPQDGPVIQAFKMADNSYSAVTFTTDAGPSGSYASQIISDLGNSVSTYNLFISADTDYPQDVYDNYPSSVSAPVVVSAGKLMHWSNGGIDLQSSWPAGFISGYTSIGICNTAHGPYGVAAEDVLEDTYGIAATAATQYSNILMVDNAVKNSVVQSGFVPTALHCNAGTVDLSAYPTATDHVFADIYDHAAVVINGSDSAANAAASAFISWLQSSNGQSTLADYCLAFPDE